MRSRILFGSIVLASSVMAQTPPATISAPVSHNYADLGIARFDQDASGNLIGSIEQIELRHIAAGVYRVVLTVLFNPPLGGVNDAHLVAGTADLTIPASPGPGADWVPDTTVAALNTQGTSTDEFQGSLSSDGLVFVWDNYTGATYPNVPVNATSFIAKRPSTAADFTTSQVFALGGVPGGGCDPHIGEELANGNVIVYHLDANGDISKGEVDPTTGTMVSSSLVAAKRPTVPPVNATVGFNHSPFVQRDSTGAARGLVYSEYVQTAGNPSNGMYVSAVDGTASPVVIADAVTDPNTPWYANPAVLGGSVFWATATSTYLDPTRGEYLMLPKANLSSGSGRIAAYAPVEPSNPARVFISAIGIGTPAPPYAIPPVQDPIVIFPSFGVLDIRFHNAQTGLAEWVFPAVPSFGGATFKMQLVALDGLNNAVRAGNDADLIMP